MNIKKFALTPAKKDKKLTVKKLENKILNRQMLRKKKWSRKFIENKQF